MEEGLDYQPSLTDVIECSMQDLMLRNPVDKTMVNAVLNQEAECGSIGKDEKSRGYS